LVANTYTEGDLVEFMRERLKEIAQRTLHYPNGRRCTLFSALGHKAGRRYAVMATFRLDALADEEACILCPIASGPQYHEETESKPLKIPCKSYPISNHEFTFFHPQAALIAPMTALHGVPRPVGHSGQPVNGGNRTLNIKLLGGDLWPEMKEEFEDHWMNVAFAPMVDLWKRECARDFEEAMQPKS
jgi:hypothetical protein